MRIGQRFLRYQFLSWPTGSLATLTFPPTWSTIAPVPNLSQMHVSFVSRGIETRLRTLCSLSMKCRRFDEQEARLRSAALRGKRVRALTSA